MPEGMNFKQWNAMANIERGSGVIRSSDVIQEVLQELIMTSGSRV